MSQRLKSLLFTTLVIGICIFGIVRAVNLDCGKQLIGTWLIVWYSIIITYCLLFEAINYSIEFGQEPGFVAGVLISLGVFIGIFASLWTFIGTGWIIQNFTNGNACLKSFDLWAAILIMVTVYVFYAFFLVLFIYFAVMDTKAASLKKSFLEELSKIYVNEKHANQINVNNFLNKYKKILSSTPMMDIEKNILLQYCSEKVKDKDDSMECGVCFIEFQPGEMKTCTSCMHCFHFDCIVGWYKLKTYCPYCKQSFREGLLKAYIENIHEKFRMEEFKEI